MKKVSSGQYLGIDIGGTTAKYAYITEKGEIIDRGSFATGHAVSKEVFLDSILRIADKAIQKNVDGIGICSLGIVNSDTGQIIGGVQNMPYLNGMNFKKLFAERYPGIPVHVCNDVKSVARGEQWVGAASGCNNFFCVALGTGLGGAVVINSQLVEGANYRAGEICYMDYKNDRDYLEKYTSTKYMMDLAAKELGIEAINGFEFFQKVQEKNHICLNILNQWIHNISKFVANIIVILDVEKIIIGGGISNEKDILIPLITEAVEQMLPPEFRNQTLIVAAKCANDAGMLGAVSAFVHKK